MSDVTTIEADVPERYADAVSARLRTAADDDVVGRLWRKDGTLWAPEGTPEVTNRLGWLDIAERSREQLDDLEALRDELRRARATPTRSCSAWAARASRPRSSASRFGPQDGALRLHVLDSTHPDEVRKFLDGLDLDKTPDGRVLEVGRDDRADVDVQGVLARAWTARTSSRSPIPGRSLEELAAGRLPARLPRRPRHRRPLQRAERLRARPRRRRRVRRRRRPGLRDRRRRGVPRRAGQRRPVARLRARRARAARAATSSRSSPTRR